MSRTFQGLFLKILRTPQGLAPSECSYKKRVLHYDDLIWSITFIQQVDVPFRIEHISSYLVFENFLGFLELMLKLP